MSVLCLAAALVLAPATPYADPDGAFALVLPPGWAVRREAIGDGRTLTEVYQSVDEDGAHIDVFVQTHKADLDPGQRAAVTKAGLDSVDMLVAAGHTVTKREESKVTFDGREALRLDLEFTDADEVAWRGAVLAVSGQRRSLAVLAYARVGDPATLKIVLDHAASIRVESRTPGKVGGFPAATEDGS